MPAVTPRAQVLNLAILGYLNEGPQHGYALRKALNLSLGTFRTLSYGSLYPALRRLEEAGYIESHEDPSIPGSLRKRIIYSISEKGRNYLDNELSSAGPGDWEDGAFDVRFSMFGSTDSETRLRILEGRYTRMLERRDALQLWADTAARHADSYATELARHGLAQVNAEVTWLENMIDKERQKKNGQVSAGKARPGSLLRKRNKEI
ncbi:MAG: PadR family transcriptional regulator [Ancrocorticia sp.]|nr:PadR family transcriptional regulator [Ancrocorticia sp.]MCI1963620.1 PadR family transcriptional regulator [Ancrocorticia sp.]MCI2002791.1 PadR family transcriptional regulator [Ancrocorticia sp.]MCI2012111.1 PadR family transcriptional regulator [Ancrocorticia sp.]MCI2029802.1 PadR family transcriptional regulator [Ancrocorticia sp.]